LWQLTDNVGSVRDIVKSVGSTPTVVDHITYTSFGKMTDTFTSGAVAHAFGYTGEVYDTETDLNYFRARFYDPSVGRFLNDDPANVGSNLYEYATNNPINLTDPTGMSPWLAQSLAQSSASSTGNDTFSTGTSASIGLDPISPIEIPPPTFPTETLHVDTSPEHLNWLSESMRLDALATLTAMNEPAPVAEAAPTEEAEPAYQDWQMMRDETVKQLVRTQERRNSLSFFQFGMKAELDTQIAQLKDSLTNINQRHDAGVNVDQIGYVPQSSVVGAGALGVGQGVANTANGVQDAAIGLVNLPGVAYNNTAGRLGAPKIGYVPSPDWSNDLITQESTHGLSKFLGGQGAFTLLTVGASELALWRGRGSL
jgi:RHS repeat-associated protein